MLSELWKIYSGSTRVEELGEGEKRKRRKAEIRIRGKKVGIEDRITEKSSRRDKKAIARKKRGKNRN